MSHFGGQLRELALHELPNNDHGWWLPRLVCLLQNSPRLRKLCLGFQRLHAHPRRSALFPAETVRQYLDALERLCHLYQETGASPLSLHSLELLEGLYPFSVDSLQKLTDLACLRDVYISTMSPLQLVGLDLEPVALQAFAPPHAPNLRYFGVNHYDATVHRHLSTLSQSHPSFVHNLGVAVGAMLPPADTVNLFRPSPGHPGLPLRLRMFDLHLRRRLWPWDMRGGEQGDDEIHRCAKQALEDLVATNADSLEGLAVSLHKCARIRDDGDRGALAKLNAQLLERNVQLLERVLPRLPNLTQLSVDGVRSDHGTLERLVLASPRLQFIHVESYRFWQVWRNDDGSVRLARVPSREADRVELWKYCRSIT